MLTHQSHPLPSATKSVFNSEVFSPALLRLALTSQERTRWVLELRQEVTPSEVSGSHLSSEGSDSHDVIVKSNCKDHNSTN